MARISGVDLPNEKRIEIALTYIFGIGRTNAKAILKQANIDGGTRVKGLTEEEGNKIAKIIEKSYTVEGDLRQEVFGNIKRLREIGTYRGMRHAHNLPARGQRTRSNARTRRGKRLTIGALKKDDRVKLDTTKPAPTADAKK
jgi:small subunit ribosomal protein S13